MAYDIYTPMQGPAVPMSIFSKAMERGAKMGTMIDTVETAKMKGEILGREKALDMQIKRENIESANINQEAARVGIERQEEALERDKRANKLAPIKEGMNIIGGAIGIAQGIQGIMSNSNVMQQQEQQIELNQIKIDTENKVGNIKNLAAENRAKLENATATRELTIMSTQDAANQALTDNDPQKLKQILDTPEFQTVMQEQPDNALSIVKNAFGAKAIDKAKRDNLVGSITAAQNNELERQIKLAQAKAQQKSKEAYDKNFQELDATMGDALGVRNKNGEASPLDFLNTEYYPRDQFEIKDGKIDTTKPSKDNIVNLEGEYVAVDSRTNEVITYIPKKGYETKKQSDAFKRSYGAIVQQQKDNAGQANVHRGKDGIWRMGPAPKPQQPGQPNVQGAGLADIKAAEKRKAATSTLNQFGIAPNANLGQQPTGVVGKVVNNARAAVNKVLPWAIDNISDADAKTADGAAEAAAKATISQYKKASPEDRKLIIDKVAQTVGGAGFEESRYYDDGYIEGKTLEGTYFKDEKGQERLKSVFKKKIVETMEYLREESPPKATPEQQKKAYARKLMESKATPGSVIESKRSYDAIRKGSAPEEKSPVEITKRIKPTLDQIEQDAGWSKGKTIRANKTVIRVENSPYLENESPQLKAIAAVESGGDPRAESPTGVKGIMQVTGDTADALNEKYGTQYNHREPKGSVELSKLLLYDLNAKYKGNKALVYAAYNAGEPAIDLARELSGNSAYWEEVRIYLYDALKALYDAGRYEVNPRKKAEETRKYPEEVLRYEELFNQLV